MANVKITELTAATALAGTDVLPIVDVGADATKKVSVSDLLRNLPDGTASAPALAFADDQNTGVLSPGNNSLAFATSGTQRLVIDSSGRVGVGTSTLTGNSGSLSILKDSSLYWRKPNGQIKGDILVDDSENIIFNQGASSTEVARIDSSGRVGIGTSSPESNRRLTVDIGTTSANVAVFKSQDAGGGSYIGFMDKDTTNGNRVRVGAINDDMAFITAGSERLRIDSSGNVGIGTAAPNSYSGYTTLTINNATTGAVLDLEVNGTRTGTFLAASGQVQLGTKTSAVLRFDTNDTERMRIDSSGNVGIGLTSPTEFVDIRKDQNAFTWAQIQNQNSSSGAYAGIQFGAHGNTWGIANGSSAANSNSLIFVTDAGGSNSEKMRIDSSGRLLVGATSGSYDFEVKKSGHIHALIGSTNAAGATLLLDGDSNGDGVGSDYASLSHNSDGNMVLENRKVASIIFRNTSSSTERMRIIGSGEVGIGTTSPVTDLEVSRTGNNADGLTLTCSDHTNSPRLFFKSTTSNGTPAIMSEDGDLRINTGGTAGSASGTERMRINSSGNVGIGETAPDVKLHINGGSDNTIVKIESSDAGARIRLTDIHASSSIEQNSNELILSSDTNSADGSSTITFKVDNSEKARLDSSGRLMVGTTSPGSSTADDLTIAKTGDVGISIRSGTSSRGNIYFADGTSGNDQFRGYIQYDHSGNYLRFATNAVERMRILSGGGITFNGDTAAANALDDYEEGTFTVTYVPSSGSFTAATYAEQNGSYTKIGNRLFFNLRIRTSGLTKGSASGDLKISGLPYDVINDSTNGRNAIAISIANEWAGDVPSGGHCQVNSDDLFLLYRDASDGAALSVTVDDMGTALNKNQLWITGSYRVS